MHQKRTRSSKPKLFQCTGFGDCNMVFTRSEHLARHSRKHTGEKPFVCVVPLCTKAFSRFDNMMQHTQTHRNNNYNIITGGSGPSHTSQKSQQKFAKENTTRSSTRVAQRQQQQQQQQKLEPAQNISKTPSYSNNSNLYIQTSTDGHTSSGLVSPVSLSSFSPKRNHTRQQSSSSSEDEDEEDDFHQPVTPSRRRLSVADLCNPPDAATNNNSNIYLTKDEYEALEGFGRFRHSPSVFFDSLKDLASTAHIEPY